tara:strand:+ start:354 stop:1244 length:891 start_codon:yes stop_codon:yes gene_type:complete
MRELSIQSITDILHENDTHDGSYNHPIDLMDFAHEVEQKTKYITLSRDKWSKWVYREKDTFALGYIAFKDVRDDKANDDDPKCIVYSPNVQNRKYTYGPRQYSVQATTIEKAVKNAATYLRPLTILQTVKLTESGCCKGANTSMYDWQREFESKKESIVSSLFSIHSHKVNALEAELKHMVNCGHEFLDKQLGQQLREAFDALTNYDSAKKNNTKQYTFVEAYESFGQNKFKCAPVDLHGYNPEVNRDLARNYGEEELPEEFKDKLAILSMLQNEQYVENVGYRAAENIFYLCTET